MSLLERVVEALGDFRTLFEEVGGLAWGGFEVVEFGDCFPFALIAGDSFPAATADGNGIVQL